MSANQPVMASSQLAHMQGSSALNTFNVQGGLAGHPTAQFQTAPQFSGPPPAYNAISHNIRPSSAFIASSELPTSFVNNTNTKSSHPLNSSLADLDILDQSLLDYKLSKEAFPIKTAPVKLPMNQLAAAKTTTLTAASHQPPEVTSSTVFVSPSPPGLDTGLLLLQPQPSTGQATLVRPLDGDFTPMVSAAPEPAQELLPLTDVFVPLDKIQPAPNIPSVTAYEKNSLKVMIHFAKDRPRPDVVTMVVSTISTNTNPITGFVFQAAVPKIMKVKLQPPSASDLPPYNPILPPAAITQVMLVANPRKEKIRLKYKLSYTLSGELISDIGDIEAIPIQ